MVFIHPAAWAQWDRHNMEKNPELIIGAAPSTQNGTKLKKQATNLTKSIRTKRQPRFDSGPLQP